MLVQAAESSETLAKQLKDVQERETEVKVQFTKLESAQENVLRLKEDADRMMQQATEKEKNNEASEK